MLHEIKQIISRNADTIVEDAIGASSLLVLLVIGLNLIPAI